MAGGNPALPRPPYTVFLGGHDLEMVTIGALARRVLGPDGVADRGLQWGAKASAYKTDLAAALGAGQCPVLVEMENDLGPRLAKRLEAAGAIWIDHHGAQAGADKPSSLRQVFELLGLPARRWTRRMTLVDANDIGHMEALRRIGATPREIRTIRNADRRAQGVTPRDETLAREALRGAEMNGNLFVIRSQTTRTSPILDFIEPEYGGRGSDDVAVVTSGTVEFYGRGPVILTLAKWPKSWSGGALPERGFWGAAAAGAAADRLLAHVVEVAHR